MASAHESKKASAHPRRDEPGSLDLIDLHYELGSRFGVPIFFLFIAVILFLANLNRWQAGGKVDVALALLSILSFGIFLAIVLPRKPDAQAQ